MNHQDRRGSPSAKTASRNSSAFKPFQPTRLDLGGVHVASGFAGESGYTCSRSSAPRRKVSAKDHSRCRAKMRSSSNSPSGTWIWVFVMTEIFHFHQINVNKILASEEIGVEEIGGLEESSEISFARVSFACNRCGLRRNVGSQHMIPGIVALVLRSPLVGLATQARYSPRSSRSRALRRLEGQTLPVFQPQIVFALTPKMTAKA